jgi:Putative auto-transporter adhesin, head GIN domain
MNKIISVMIVGALLALGSVAAGCSALHILTGSGHTTEKTYDYSGFTGVSAGWDFHVEVTHADAYAVSVTVDDNLEQYLNVSQNGGTLEIRMDGGYVYTHTHFTAVIQTPRLELIDLSGATRGTVTGFQSADDFNLKVSGASQATLSDMAVNRLTIDVSGASRAAGDIDASGNTSVQVSGASNVTISGKGVDADIESSGASTANLEGYAVRDARANVSGASNATVSASGTISGNISGASHLYYTGSPTLGNISTSGASSISKK